MSITSLFTKSPTLKAGSVSIEFDAILEDTFEASVTLTDYPIEVGSSSNDHRIRNPYRWQLVGGISNNPVTISVSDFTGLLSELTGDDGETSLTATYMSGWLSGTDNERPQDALETLLKIMNFGDPFDVDAGDISLTNMVIESIRRVKNPQNQNALVFVAQLREWMSIETAVSAGTSTTNAITGDSTASAAANAVNNGEQSTSDASSSITDTISGWFE